MVAISYVLQLIVTGVLMGGVLALLAVGLTLIYGVLHIINLAHGAFVVLGGFIAFWGWQIFGINPYLMLLPTFVIMFLLGLPLKRFLFEPIQDTELLNQLLLTFGLALAAEALMAIVWSANQRIIRWDLLIQGFSTPVMPVRIIYNRLIAFVGALIIFGALFFFLYRTKLGRGIRAAADSKDTASIVGVDVNRIELLVFGLGTALAGVGGTFLITIVPLTPYSGIHYVLLAFVIVTLGGMGSVFGSLVGGILIGLVQTLSAIWLTQTQGTSLVFLLLLVLFLLKPKGLFGKVEEGLGNE